MATVTDNFSITRGDTYVETLAFTLSGSPIDLTGGKLYFTIKNNFTDADPGILQLTSPASGIVITNAAGGLATLTITATQTAALTVGTYLYDLQFKDAAGLITTFTPSGSRITVNADVTISTA